MPGGANLKRHSVLPFPSSGRPDQAPNKQDCEQWDFVLFRCSAQQRCLQVDWRKTHRPRGRGRKGR